jgi:ABC-2 type transport system ATP-binding protein
VQPDSDGSLTVTGIASERVAELAMAEGISLHELAPRAVSLEEIFMELTQESVEYRAVLDPAQYSSSMRSGR